MSIRFMVACLLLVGSLAHADKPKAKKPPKPEPVVGRVVGLEVYSDDEGHPTSVVTVLVGSEQGVKKGWRALFREGTTTKLLSGGDAIIIRIDKRATIMKIALSPEQVRANKFVELAP